MVKFLYNKKYVKNMENVLDKYRLMLIKKGFFKEEIKCS